MVAILYITIFASDFLGKLFREASTHINESNEAKKPFVVVLLKLRLIFAFDDWNIDRTSSFNVNPHSAGIDFSRQSLTSVDVRF